MAVQRWTAVIADINNAISKMNTASDAARRAAEKAKKVANDAQKIADDASKAADKAERIALEASELASAWKNATVTAVTLEEGQNPYVTVQDQEDGKRIIIGVPKGATGEKGDKGADGVSGVTFKLENSTLYITKAEA